MIKITNWCAVTPVLDSKMQNFTGGIATCETILKCVQNIEVCAK